MGMKELYEDNLMETYDQEMQQCEQEFHERTYGVLSYLKDILKPDDFSPMCYHCGFNSTDFTKEQ